MFEIGTGSLLSNDELQKGNIPRISAKSDNNGIIEYFNTESSEKARHFENFISVNFFGVDGGIFYHPYKASVEMKVHTLKIPNINFNLYNATFIIGALKKILNGFGYGNQLSSSKLKNLNFFIKLPTKNNKIDFEFMEEFIKELENAKLQKIKEYLKENNLEDTNLTDKEKEALEKFEKVEWGEFRIGDLFEGISGDFDIQKKHINEKGEYVITSGLENQGVLGKSDVKAKIIKEKTFTIDMFGNSFYRAFKYKMVTHARVFGLLPNFDISDNIGIFIVNSLKFLQKKFGYENMCSWKKIKDEKIKLPTKNNKIDFEFMENFISGLEKLIVRKIIPLIKETNEP